MFHRTQNENGTFNTRCLDCLMSAATSVESPAELTVIEERHRCAEMVLQMVARMQAQAETIHHSQ
jgi:hypothetical protein